MQTGGRGATGQGPTNKGPAVGSEQDRMEARVIPGKFEYHRPSSVDEAIALLTQHGDDSRLLAGGHSLIPMMKTRLARPST